MRRLIILLLVFFAGQSMADTSAEVEQSVELKVRPVLCITDERTPSCKMSFLVVWKSGQTGFYCLYSDFDDSPVRCWTDKRSGELTDEHIVQTDFSYWMTGNDDESLLAVVAVEVLRMDTGDRRRNRRSRHVWDIL